LYAPSPATALTASHGRHLTAILFGLWCDAPAAARFGARSNLLKSGPLPPTSAISQRQQMKDLDMTRDEVFPSKYLKAADLKGKPRIVKIESAPYETLKGLDGRENRKIVLYFENVPKSLPLNATNFDAVCDATGFPDTEGWPEHQIELYPSKTTMGGKTMDCIRIRRPSSRPTAAAAPPTPPTKTNGEMNDEIPW
jgi:hypothetical protein